LKESNNSQKYTIFIILFDFQHPISSIIKTVNIARYEMAPPRKIVQKIASTAHEHDSSIHTKIIPKELVCAIVSGIACAIPWKMLHLSERRKVQDFYSRLEAGDITVIADE
jgi:hypothetical protein